jgi:hypothetical protein
MDRSLDDREILELFKKFDADGNGMVTYDEFLAAVSGLLCTPGCAWLTLSLSLSASSVPSSFSPPSLAL